MDPLTRLLYPGSINIDDGNEYPFILTEGTIIDISLAGITFTINNWNAASHLKHGPAPFASWAVTGPGVSSVVGPSVGDRCLVAFLGTGLENPWVIGWWPS